MERVIRTRTDKGETVSSRMVETRSQKSAEEQKATLEVEVHPDQAMHENQELHDPDGRGNRRVASESTPLEQRQDSAKFHRSIGPRGDVGTVRHLCCNCGDLKISYRQHYDGRRNREIGNVHIIFKKAKKSFGNFFPFTMGACTGDEGESQEDEEDSDEHIEFGSRVSLNFSTQEIEAYTDRETGTMDNFDVVRTISKDTNTPGQSRDFVSMTNWEMRTGKNRKTRLSNATADPEVDHD